MDQENTLKTWLTSAVFEQSCKSNFITVQKKILDDPELAECLQKYLTNTSNEQHREKVKPVFILNVLLKKLMASVEDFASDVSTNSYPWNSDGLPEIIKLLERTFEQCDFISLRKFFSLITQLKFLDLMHLLRLKVDAATLIQKLNVHFPRWQGDVKLKMEKRFFIDNPKALDKVEESNIQCRRLILKLAADPSYRASYMSNQFFTDMKKMMRESVLYLNEVINSLTANAGLTVIEKGLNQQISSEDLGYQILLDYIQTEVHPETLIRFLDEMETSLSPPTGGFSSCLLPFDTMSECSEIAMESDCESVEEVSGEEDSEENDTTIVEE